MNQTRLSGGKTFRVLDNTYTQVGMFGLSKNENKFFDPKVEHIATLKELDEIINRRNYSLNFRDNIRSDQIVFYLKGCEKYSSVLTITPKMVWMEIEGKSLYSNFDKSDRVLVAILDLSNVFNEKIIVDGRETTFNQATGMGIIPISKLEIKTIRDTQDLIVYKVVPTSDFNPLEDLRIKEIATHSWSDYIDNDGFPLSFGSISSEEGIKNKNARFFSIVNSNEFLGINMLYNDILETLRIMGIARENFGYFGSVGYSTIPRGPTFFQRCIFADQNWSTQSRVILVSPLTNASLG